jgi:hypothetical protein
VLTGSGRPGEENFRADGGLRQEAAVYNDEGHDQDASVARLELELLDSPDVRVGRRRQRRSACTREVGRWNEAAADG